MAWLSNTHRFLSDLLHRSEKQEAKKSDTTIQDRAAGAITGAFIGDALGLGPHWYYDLAELRRDYGEWINDYTDPQPGRYHAGLKAGQPTQAGCILKLTLSSLVVCGQYDEVDFCRGMDEELLPLLDGTPITGYKHECAFAGDNALASRRSHVCLRHYR